MDEAGGTISVSSFSDKFINNHLLPWQHLLYKSNFINIAGVQELHHPL